MSIYLYVSIFYIHLLSIHTRAYSSHISYNRRVSFLKALSSINDDENISSSNTKTKRTVPNRPSVKRTSLSDKDNDIITFIANEMRSNFLFQSCNHSTIVNLARQFVVCEYEPGYAIIEQGKRCMLHCIFTYSYTIRFWETNF